VSLFVDHEVAVCDSTGLVGITPAATEKGFDSKPELFEAKGLGQVVVASLAKSGAEVIEPIPGGQEDDRHLMSVAAQTTTDLETVEVWKVDVEDHKIGGCRPHRLESIDSSRGHCDSVAGEAKGGGDHVRQAVFVIHHQEMGWGFWHARM
jgi:hypothetical protein